MEKNAFAFKQGQFKLFTTDGHELIKSSKVSREGEDGEVLWIKPVLYIRY